MPGKYCTLSRILHNQAKLFCLVGLSWVLPYNVLAGDCQLPVAEIVSLQGVVESQTAGSHNWTIVHQSDKFCAGDHLRVRANSRAGLFLNNETFLRLSELSNIRFSGPDVEPSTWLELIRGIAHFMSRVKHSFEIRTAYVNAGIEGTEFTVRVDNAGAQVTVMEGAVIAQNDLGSVRLSDGQSALAVPGQAPVLQLKVQPRDAVQWALYYPSVLHFDSVEMQGALAQSLDAYRRGDLAQAFSAVTDLNEQQQDARFYTYRATLNLSVGRIGYARADIDQALKLQAENADALALKSIIATVQNQTDTALELAQRAIAVNQRLAGPRIALSYALQARFELEQARNAVILATELEPDNALAWSRLAELQLMQRDLDAASQASQRAVELDPGMALTQTSRGFARLLHLDIEAAKEHFEQAVVLDQAAPLPRLGLGLAMIREGRLVAGRREIEIATSLDPGNSLIRSYLGKAYFEEKRDELAATEFVLAMQMDPLDPTPWFYDAIRKQTDNRPVEALHELQRSIELNDNRAVYRSRLLLDEDLAARSASLGRIYGDLGFEQLALVEGWNSVNTDPANYSGHRLLADTYSSLPRHEIARVSELLQAQLLQPININPLQPQMTAINLGIHQGAGPSNLSYNEFNPLFTRNQVDFQADGIVGSNDTWGEALVISGLQDKLSYSIGQFHYETDGFRENNDLQHDIYDVFAQLSLSPKSNIQFELRSQDTESGDIQFRFDEFFPADRYNTEINFGRIGYHYTPTPSSDVLVSIAYQDRTEESFEERFGSVFGFDTREVTDTVADADGYTVEAQFLFGAEPWNLTAGAGYFHQNAMLTRTGEGSFLDFPSFPPIPLDPEQVDLDANHKNAYLYSTFRMSPKMTWTLGASYDRFNDQNAESNQFNPKFGLTLDLSESTRFRFAAFRTLKRALLSNQTIEPTQVAGFNQFFDDLNGSDAKRYGIALDQRFSKDLYAGIELTQRELDVPRFPPSEGEQQDEDFHRAYAYWTPSSRVSISAEYQFDDFERDVPRNRELGPNKLTTQTVPVRLGYYAPNQLFSALKFTYVNQHVEFAETTTGTDFRVIEEDEDFLVTDFEIGYRLPKRTGIASFIVKNLFDEQFNFQDRNFQATSDFIANSISPMYVPERTMFLKLTLAL